MFHATGLPGWMRAGEPATPSFPSPEDEKESLEYQLDYLQAQIAKIRKRLDEIAAAKKGKRS